MSFLSDRNPYLVAGGALAAGIAIGVFGKKLLPKKTAFGGMNRPTAGARFNRQLERGKHDLQLYSMATPNGQKVTIMLEELGVPYDAHYINIMNGDQFSSGFTQANPNSKIPTMIDYGGSQPINLFESGSILLYLAEKYGKFIPKDPVKRTECLNWLFFQMGSGPYIGQFGHFFKYAPEKIEYAIDRYTMETQRILDVLDKHLEGKSYICGDELTIADFAWWPWVQCIDWGYKARDVIGLDKYKNLMAWCERIGSRAAVKQGRLVNNGWSEGGQKDYSTDGKK